ncbi:MAG: BlaI/MecI/CopY family transcriptional regulator [Flavobacteriaceae bacterium]|nr:BlaI/MecI/CopY family transcriptional regulator [Flavobacteriaceae bacterium]
MKELTKAEEQVMHHVWKLKNAFLKEIVDQYPEPKPAYTTISTVVRVLVKKQFLGFFVGEKKFRGLKIFQIVIPFNWAILAFIGT